MTFYAQSDIGMYRSENQDSYGISDGDGTLLAVVCDGMGGLQDGKLAAKIATRTFLESFHRFYRERRESVAILSAFDIKRVFCNAVYTANRAVLEEADARGVQFAMGTTLTSVFASGKQLYYAHVGDSRTYLWQNGELSRLTKDHSYVQELIDAGKLTEEEARIHPKKNLITRALGATEDVEPSFGHIDLSEGNKILLCTDGLTGALSDMEIAEILSEELPVEETVSQLIAGANLKSGEDNITALCLVY